jgi:cytochrome c oxidase cbb3-type subunit I/II
LTAGYVDAATPKPRIDGVLDVGKKIDVWTQASWHRVWERLPIRFTVWVTIAVVVASLFEIIPTFLIRSNIPTIDTVKPYTPLELAGRDIYVSEGCYNCHSQMIRPMFAETERYGEYSKPGEFIYDHPFQWGSRRIGPDLAREGGRQSDYWHLQHFRDPSKTNRDSVMPAYAHLETTKLNYRGIPARVKAAHMLGAPYDKELEEAEEMARLQARAIVANIVSQGGLDRAYFDPDFVPTEGELVDESKYVLLEESQVIALIAYMQRIGIDISAAPETPAVETPNAEVPAAAEPTNGDALPAGNTDTATPPVDGANPGSTPEGSPPAGSPAPKTTGDSTQE